MSSKLKALLFALLPDFDLVMVFLKSDTKSSLLEVVSVDSLGE